MDMDKKFLLLMCMILLIGSAMPLVSSAPPTVTLISPEDEAEAFIREPIWFNATATATIGIKNISLYGNFSGTWLLNKTTNFNSTSPINYPHLTGTQGSSGASSNPVGYNINMTSEGYLASVQKVTTTTSTYAYVYFLNNTLIQKSNAFSGDWATFTPEVHLINGGKYRVRVDAEGGAFNSGFSGEIMPYPAYRTFFLYDFGNYWYEDTSPNRERWIGIQSINMTNSTSVSLPTYYAENFTATIGGTTLWNVEACNSNGMCNFAENNWTVVGISSDQEPPNISITFPTNTTYNYNVTNLNYTYSDLNPSSCWYSINGGATNSSLVSAGINFTGVGYSESENTWNLYCNDTYGNQNSTSVTFTIDTIPPLVNIVYPTNTTYYINISTLDYTTNGTNCWYSLNGGATNNSIACGTNLTDLTSNEGANTWIVWANDSYWTSSSSVLFYKYTIPPTLSIVYPTNTSYNIDVTTMDYATDGVNCWYSTDLGVTNNTITCGINITGLTSAQGTNTWMMWANNSFGEISSSITFFKDTIPPSVNIVYPLNTTYNIDVTTMDYSVDDAVNCWYSLDDGVTNSTPVSAGINFTGLISNQGTNNWRTYCNDSLNNIGNNYVTFYKDTLPPSVNLTNPANNTLTNAIQNFTASISDPSGIQNATFYVYNSSDVLINSSFIELTGTPTSANIGTYLQLTSDDTFRWYYEATDIYGQKATSEAFYITIDLEIPTITWYAPSSSVSTSSSPYTINVSVTNTHLNTTNVTVRSFSGSLIYSNFTTNIGVPFVWLVDAVTLNERTNTLTICAKDEATNEICENKIITLDTIAPSGQSGGSTGGGGGTSPANRSYTPTSPTNFTVNASDINGTGISNITLVIKNETGSIINETTQETGGVLSGFFGFIYNLWYEGVYKWFFIVVDNVGNIFSTGESYLTYDITSPSGAIVYPLNTNYSTQITAMNVSFNETNVFDCWYNAGGSNVSLTDTSNEAVSSYNILIDAYENPDNSITFMNDSNLSTYSFWNGTSGGLATRLNLSYKIDYDRVSNARWIFDYYPIGVYVDVGYCTNGYFCYWDWNNNSWKDLVYGCSEIGCWDSHFVKNISLPSNAINNVGDIKVMSPLMFTGNGAYSMSVYETYITYTKTGRDCSDTTITGLASSEGSNTWKFWVNDSVGFVNESAVTFVQDTGQPLVTIYSPTSSYYNTTSVLVNLSATDDTTSISQIWWNDNGGANNTYSSPLVVNFTEGTHNFRMYAKDSVNNVNTTNVSFIVDTTNPLINLLPISAFSTDVFPANISINYSINDTNMNTCWFDNGENLNESLTVDDTTYWSGSYSQEYMSQSHGIYRFAMKKFICGDVSKLGVRTKRYQQPTANWSITIRSVATDEILLEKNMGSTSNLSNTTINYYEADFNTSKFICEDVYLSEEANLSSGYLVIAHENDAPFHWAFYNGTWNINYSHPYAFYHGFVYNGNSWSSDDGYNGVPMYKLTINNKVYDNGTLDCSGTNASIPITRDGNHTFTIYGIDNSNFISSDSETFYTLFHSFNQGTAINVTTEGDVLDFTLDIDMTDFHTTEAFLVYNGVDYPSTNFDINGNSISFTKTLTIPDGTGSPSGAVVNWYWRYFVEGNSWLVDNYTTAPQNQTVYSVEIDDCSVFNDTIFHFDLNDEETDTTMNMSLNPIVEVDAQIISLGDNNIYWQFSQTYNSNNGSICVPNTLLNISSYKFNGVLSYITNTYVQEFWYIDNGLLKENTFALDDFTNRNITLRDLLLDDSQTFLFKYYNEKFLTQPNSIVTVLRNYVGEGVYKEVERCKLDDNGECHLHLVEEDVIYKFRITTNGVEDYLSGEYNAKCVETPCSITLQKEIVTEEWDTVHNNLPEGTYHIETDKTDRNVTLTFNLNETGIMQLDVFKYSNVINSPDTLVGTKTVTAKTGEISVVVPLAYGNQTYYAVVRHNTGFVSSVWVDLNEDGYKYFGNLGLFLGALLVLSLGLVAISSGGWTIAFLILGLLVASITKLVNMDFYLIMFIISAGGLIIWKLASRRSL